MEFGMRVSSTRSVATASYRALRPSSTFSRSCLCSSGSTSTAAQRIGGTQPPPLQHNQRGGHHYNFNYNNNYNSLRVKGPRGKHQPDKQKTLHSENFFLQLLTPPTEETNGGPTG